MPVAELLGDIENWRQLDRCAAIWTKQDELTNLTQRKYKVQMHYNAFIFLSQTGSGVERAPCSTVIPEHIC